MATASPFRSGFTRLDRYIFKQVLTALIAVTVALVALIWLTQSLRFVELIVNRGLSPFVFLRLTVLLIPSFIAVILPITTFVVVQFVYQRLAGDRELTVMRAAGHTTALKDGSRHVEGPFHDRDEAQAAWQRLSRQQSYVATARFTIATERLGAGRPQ